MSQAQTRRERWYPTAAVAGGAILLALILWRLDRDALHTATEAEGWGFLALAVLAGAASGVAKAVVWRDVLNADLPEGRPARLRDLVGPTFAGLMLNSLLAARLGEVARVVLASRRLERSGTRPGTPTLVASVVTETLATTLVWVLMVAGVGLVLPLPVYAVWISAAIGIACVVLVVVLALVRPALPDPSARGVRGTLARMPAALARSGRALRRPSLALRLGCVAVGGWLLQLVGVWAVLSAFGLGRVGLAGAALLVVTTSVAAALPLLPASLVTFQAAVVLPLVASYGVPAATALSVAVVLQLTQVAGAIALGSAALLQEGVRVCDLRQGVAGDRTAPASRGLAPAWRFPRMYEAALRAWPPARVLRRREEAAVLRALDTVAAPAHRVLEIGAGTGWYTLALAGRTGRVAAVEPPPAMRRRLGRRVGGESHVEVTDGRLPDRLGERPAADGVLCAGVLDFFPDLTEALIGAAAALTPRGWMVVTVPARGADEPSSRRWSPLHARRYAHERDVVVSAVGRAGLTLVRTELVRRGGRPRTFVLTLRREGTSSSDGGDGRPGLLGSAQQPQQAVPVPLAGEPPAGGVSVPLPRVGGALAVEELEPVERDQGGMGDAAHP
jgi:SAM-dependent methyltransferase